MILVIDNYDSFTFNLVHYLLELGAEVEVRRNDALSARDALAMAPDALLLSPGPCTPDEAGICLELVQRAAEARVPLLGVCLGHQALAQAFGGRVVRAPTLMHGKTSPVQHDGSGVFAGLPSPFTATRYHSLVAERASLPPLLVVNAWTEDGVVMGLRHATLPLHGVQFHPESILTDDGLAMLGNFLNLLGARAC
ncbi:MAG: anthranilate synthase component II [Thermaurantiacus tibetensis]